MLLKINSQNVLQYFMTIYQTQNIKRIKLIFLLNFVMKYRYSSVFSSDKKKNIYLAVFMHTKINNSEKKEYDKTTFDV